MLSVCLPMRAKPSSDPQSAFVGDNINPLRPEKALEISLLLVFNSNRLLGAGH